jgi:hypothetical protein
MKGVSAMSDSVADRPVELLQWHANQLRLIAQQ